MAMIEPRSWLFVPGDSERKQLKALDAGADALIIDLEDSVAEGSKPTARDQTAAWVRAHMGQTIRPKLWVRINPLDSDWATQDVDCIARAQPDGIVLPKAEGPQDVARLAAMLDAIDPASTIKILPIGSETPRAVFRLGDFADQRIDRLAGISWGAEDLATAVGATGNRHPDGTYHDLFRTVRSFALLAAHAAGVQAIDTLHADFRDDDGLRTSSEAARREGFTGRLAIHPAQVSIINAAFSASPEDVAHAERIIAAFASAGGAGTVGLDGKMVDRPHLLQAERLLARHHALLR